MSKFSPFKNFLMLSNISFLQNNEYMHLSSGCDFIDYFGSNLLASCKYTRTTKKYRQFITSVVRWGRVTGRM